MNKQDNSQEEVVYIREDNPFLKEILIATGKFIEDPDPDYEFLITTIQEARRYNYNINRVNRVNQIANGTDTAYYWEQIEKKLSV